MKIMSLIWNHKINALTAMEEAIIPTLRMNLFTTPIHPNVRAATEVVYLPIGPGLNKKKKSA
ncbi:hypothetical protein [Bacillus sp. 1NLA3E]|uniref:hypothetical protein n=1 Tax=Bacillus sp. 1NLA3E TaxID=666686 RepID=UPI000247F447|nr:hypothetical protein [Bacillus sp. 1NLA3E]